MRRFALRFRLQAPVMYPVGMEDNVTLTAREPFVSREGGQYYLPKINGSAVAGRVRRVLVRNVFRAIEPKLTDRTLKTFLAGAWSSGSAMDKFLKKLYGDSAPFAKEGADVEMTRKLMQADPIFRLIGYLVLGMAQETYHSQARFSMLYPSHEEVIEKRYSSFLQEFTESVSVKKTSVPLALRKHEDAGVFYTSPLETIEFGVRGSFFLELVKQMRESGDTEGAQALAEAIKVEKENGKEKRTTGTMFYALCISPEQDLIGELMLLENDPEVADAFVSILYYSFAEAVPLYGSSEVRQGNYLGMRSSRGFGKVELEIYEGKDTKFEKFAPVEFTKAVETVANAVDVDTLKQILT